MVTSQPQTYAHGGEYKRSIQHENGMYKASICCLKTRFFFYVFFLLDAKSSFESGRDRRRESRAKRNVIRTIHTQDNISSQNYDDVLYDDKDFFQKFLRLPIVTINQIATSIESILEIILSDIVFPNSKANTSSASICSNLLLLLKPLLFNMSTTERTRRANSEMARLTIERAPNVFTQFEHVRNLIRINDDLTSKALELTETNERYVDRLNNLKQRLNLIQEKQSIAANKEQQSLTQDEAENDKLHFDNKFLKVRLTQFGNQLLDTENSLKDSERSRLDLGLCCAVLSSYSNFGFVLFYCVVLFLCYVVL